MSAKNHSFRNFSLVILLTALNIFRNFLWLIPSSLMAPIMEEMRLSYTQSGYLLMIVTVMMGVFLICGSWILEWLSPAVAMCLGLLLMACDGFFALHAHSFPLLMVGKVLLGVGYGLSACASLALIPACFPREQLGRINGIHTCIQSLSINLAYRFIVPLEELSGSWRREAFYLAIAGVIIAIVFILWGSIFQKELRFKDGDSEEKGRSIREAMSYKLVRAYVLITSCVMLLYVYLSSYYPNYLHAARGLSLAKASTLVGYISISGMLGSLFLGFVYHFIQRHKLVTVCLLLLCAAGFFGMVFLGNESLLIPSICIFGASFSAMTLLFSTRIMSIEGITPLVASAGVSMMSACGSLLALVVPRVQDVLATALGLQTALALFGLLFVPAAVTAFALKKESH